MANQKLPIIDWTSGKIKELPSVEEKKAFEDYCKSKGIEELDIDEFYNTLKDFKNDDKLDHEIVNDKSIDAIKDNFTPPGAKDEEPMEVEKMPDDMREAYKTHAKKIANDSLESLIRNKDKAYVKYNDEIADIYKGELDERAKKPSEELDAYTKDLEDYLDKNPDAKKKNYY